MYTDCLDCLDCLELAREFGFFKRPSRTAPRAPTCSATSATSSCAPRGWWSTQGCTISAGLASRPSSTCRTTLTALGTVRGVSVVLHVVVLHEGL